MTTGVMSLPVHTVQVCSAWKVLFYFSSSLVSVDLLDSVFTGIGCVISTSWIVTIDTKWINCHSQLYLLQRWWGLLRNSRNLLRPLFKRLSIWQTFTFYVLYYILFYFLQRFWLDPLVSLWYQWENLPRFLMPP